MKLIIQIPCYNEEKSLPITLKELPRKVKGFKKVEWLIINDGSTDNTVDVAKKLGVDHIVSLTKNKGLAEVFKTGLQECVNRGADVIVNTDADNQYNANDIPALVAPIVEGKADIVIGARPILETKHFSLIKKILQKAGSFAVRLFSRTDIPDAPSGFRAYSKDAALKMNVFNSYTYTIETIIQAGLKNMAITWVPIRTNEDLRPSRLVKSIWNYSKKSLITIFRIYMVYKPFQFFATMGTLFLIAGAGFGVRYLYLFFNGAGKGHVQSVVFSSALLIIGFFLLITALIVDLQAVNRKLLEDIQFRIKKMELENKAKKK